MCTLLVEYVPSLQSAVAPAGAPAGARTVGIAAGASVPDGDGLGAGDGAVAGAEVVLRFVDLVEVLREERGFAGVAVVFAGVRSVEAVDRDDLLCVEIRLATPPCAEHRPFDDVAVE